MVYKPTNLYLGGPCSPKDVTFCPMDPAASMGHVGEHMAHVAMKENRDLRAGGERAKKTITESSP